MLPSLLSTASMCWTNIRSAFLPFSGIQTAKRPWILHVLVDVVLAERRIGEHAVEALEFAVVGLVLRLRESCPPGGCRHDWMPCRSMFILQMDQVVPDAFLPGEREVVRDRRRSRGCSRATGSACRPSRRSGRRCSCPACGSTISTIVRTTSAGV